MTSRRRVAAFLLLAALVDGRLGGALTAQSVSLSIVALSSDSTSPAPVMNVTGVENRPELGPYTVSLVMSLEPQFRTPFYARAVSAENASFTIDSLLPERTVVYFQVRLSDRFGNVVAQQIAQHAVRSWLRLVSPLRGPTTTVDTRTPRFFWSSPVITTPPGPWVYDLSVFNTRTGKLEFSQTITRDTSYMFPDSLESNASYHWQVRAHAQTGPPSDTVTVTSPGTFVIATSPTATVFYANFPNPFGRNTRSPHTCFWFDLGRAATVKLTIFDLRLHEVRRIVPNSALNGILPAGAYGHDTTTVGTSTGCDERVSLSWDGRDATGRIVPAGVYLAIFEGDGVRQSTKILFKGQ